jgi:transcriptional regulator with XRE-family HTH domain
MAMRFRLLDYCRSHRLSLSELARWSGISRVSLSRYAHGAQDISLSQLLKISAALGCSLSELVDDREDLSSPFWRSRIRRQTSGDRTDKSWVPRALLAARQARGHPA